ncbi:hypothetical protein ACFOEK_17735 [Litoribrevibacter euphylliae]|uniref:DUF4157 domain-containing protein n=1 Tax=Litoribrevibacter euphylliae TaxID=1834034 RepID=A0ABV7HL56_9GAMM
MISSRKYLSQFKHGIMTIALLGLVGCSDFFPIAKHSPAKDDFIALAEDNRVLYKQGMKSQALLIQSVLNEQIKIVEEVHGKPFVNPPIVHLCDTRECFAKYTGIKSGVIAAVSTNGLFLKPYVITHEDYKRWLGHELSHVHLRQQISTFEATFIPSWYQEGLATYLSSGGGATQMTRAKAIDYIKQGKHIVAVDDSSPFSEAWPLNYDVSKTDWPKPWYQQHMNYLQAALFYEFLHPRGGVELIRALENGDSFNQAFIAVYGKKPEDMFMLFKNSLATNQSDQE